MDTEERRHALERRGILSAYVLALEEPATLLDLCASIDTDADDDDLISAVAAAFAVSEVAAAAIVDLQVRRFTPRRIAQLRAEPADLVHRLAVG
ncbi:hypothetical protein GCM10009775_14730 [Microbacterium aoyamense]|uniref:DNA topoisomerase (ATP-hydrolyzing) n=1 Tax=Microbacterium aoyamense TaxID=344166 RepID=A0ABN2PL92_9MICO|nr:hypothetical protein [Microbacterium aoyamense]